MGSILTLFTISFFLCTPAFAIALFLRKDPPAFFIAILAKAAAFFWFAGLISSGLYFHLHPIITGGTGGGDIIIVAFPTISASLGLILASLKYRKLDKDPKLAYKSYSEMPIKYKASSFLQIYFCIFILAFLGGLLILYIFNQINLVPALQEHIFFNFLAYIVCDLIAPVFYPLTAAISVFITLRIYRRKFSQ